MPNGIERKFEPKIVKQAEKGEKIDELTERKIHEHLEYRAEIEKKELSKVLKERMLISDMNVHDSLIKKIFDRNKKAVEQLKEGKPGKELLFKLDSPTKKEEETEQEHKIYFQLLGTEGITPEEKNFIKERISYLEDNIAFHQGQRENWRKELEKLGEERKEK